jgi:tetratricopeptide (TPR) repeat protein
VTADRPALASSVAALLIAAWVVNAEAAPLWPDLVQPHRRRCVELLEAGLQARAHDQLQDAIRVLRNAVAACPDDREVLQSLGETLLTARQYPEARQALEHAQTLAREQPSTHETEAGLAFHLGFAREVTGDLDGAIEAHRALAAMGGLPPPNQYLVHYDLGDELMATGRLGEAIDEYRLAVQLAPDKPIPRLAYAVALDRDGQTDRAHAEIAIVLSLDPQLRRLDGDEYVFVPPADAHFYRALAATERGMMAEARAELRAYLAELVDGPYTRHARARLAAAESRVDPRELELAGAGIDARSLAAALSPSVRALEDCVPGPRVMRVPLSVSPAGIRSQPSHPAAVCVDRVLGQPGGAMLRVRSGHVAFTLPLAGRRAAPKAP